MATPCRKDEQLFQHRHGHLALPCCEEKHKPRAMKHSNTVFSWDLDLDFGFIACQEVPPSIGFHVPVLSSSETKVDGSQSNDFL